jgi:pimeloyl-ACP methyl ester carboxylesterase
MQSDTAAPDALRAFVTDVLNNTGNGYGTGQVSMIGHSQGGMQIRHMLQHYPSAPVSDAISLAGSHKGSAHPLGPVCWAPACPAGLAEQLATSPFYDHLNPGCATGGTLDDMNCWAPAYGSADYTNITTVTDELVVPYWRALMGPYPHIDTSGALPRHFHSSDKVSDIVLQAWCPAAQAEHVTMLTDPHVFRLILDALGRTGPADATLPCAQVPQQ